MQHFLDFERPIVDLEAKIEELRRFDPDRKLNISAEIQRLETKNDKLTRSIFSDLTPWQVAQLARHPLRPYTLDLIEKLFTAFIELHGDRKYADDAAIVAGIARMGDRGVVVIGHQKGRGTSEKVNRNFGMPRPEGFRKAYRIMKLAEQYQLPIITFIDTPGAYPGIDAEERGQSEAIARCISLMTNLRVPIISVVTGEGGSGGALAIGVCDRLLMLEYATYSVISPEGCASILWKDPAKADLAARVMKITSTELKQRNLVDEVLAEPLGGAHRDIDAISLTIQEAIQRHINELKSVDIQQVLDERYKKLRSYGVYIERS